MKETSKNVIIYLRVSTDEQAKGFSLLAQEEELLKWCESKGHKVIKCYKDDHSAKDFKRPAWTELIAFSKANKASVDMVLCYKWDRFSRSVQHAHNTLALFEKMGIEINTTQEYIDFSVHANLYMLNMYLTSGEVERKHIAQRTALGTNKARRLGYYTGRAPYGYDNGRDELKKSTIIPNANAQFVKLAFEEVSMNMEPVDTIRIKLNKLGMKLGRTAFSDMLKNVVYAGLIYVPEYLKEPAHVVDGRHQPIIDKNTFYKVQEIFKSKRWYGLKPSHKNIDFPLRDFLKCELCGGQITGSTSRGRSKKYAYYHCRYKCKTRVSSDVAHSHIADLLSSFEINQNVKHLFAAVLKDCQKEIDGNRETQLKRKIETKEILNKKLLKAQDMVLEGDLSPESFKSMVSRYTEELRDVNTEIDILSSTQEGIDAYINDSIELLSNLNNLFLESDYNGKRIIAGSIFPNKLIFGNSNCRTEEPNTVIAVLAGVSKEKAAISDSFSALVPRAGIEPA